MVRLLDVNQVSELQDVRVANLDVLRDAVQQVPYVIRHDLVLAAVLLRTGKERGLAKSLEVGNRPSPGNGLSPNFGAMHTTKAFGGERNECGVWGALQQEQVMALVDMAGHVSHQHDRVYTLGQIQQHVTREHDFAQQARFERFESVPDLCLKVLLGDLLASAYHVPHVPHPGADRLHPIQRRQGAPQLRCPSGVAVRSALRSAPPHLHSQRCARREPPTGISLGRAAWRARATRHGLAAVVRGLGAVRDPWRRPFCLRHHKLHSRQNPTSTPEGLPLRACGAGARIRRVESHAADVADPPVRARCELGHWARWSIGCQWRRADPIDHLLTYVSSARPRQDQIARAVGKEHPRQLASLRLQPIERQSSTWP
mmetsp:Transcript_59259/g.180722  ORF Transcript_59259/g.180722 Transcript_59259/m.180722 type:complete len:371 (-) Transcript_59259:59-1171(-)